MKKNSNLKNFVGKVNVSNSLLKSLVLIQKNYSPDEQKKHLSNLKNFKKFINSCERKLKNNSKKVLIVSFNSNNKYKIKHVLMKNITEIASGFLGDLVVQNKEGKKMWLFMTAVEIYL